MPKTARILNGEFLNSDRPAIVYTYSLGVPGNRGAEIPMLADIFEIGRKTGQTVIAITSDGFAGKTNLSQKAQMIDFWNHVDHNYDVLRQLLPNGKHITVTGASFGGAMAQGMAMVAEEQALKSGHLIYIDNLISVATPGLSNYSTTDKIGAVAQSTLGQGLAAIKYALGGNNLTENVQRSIEILSTLPRHPDQLGAIACTAVAILRAPLQNGAKHLPHRTEIYDMTFSGDPQTQPGQRSQIWKQSGHPNVNHVQESGDHLELLTKGRGYINACLLRIASLYETQENTVKV